MNKKQCSNARKTCNIVLWICRICRYSPKKHAHDQQKQTWSINNDRALEKWRMQYRLCIMPFLEVTILFNQHLHYRVEYRGKIPDGHSNPTYSVLKLLKLQNFWRIFDRPSAMYCKYAEYACKLQTNLSMNNKHCHDMQKKCNIVLLF